MGVCSSDYLKFGLSNLYLYDASIEFIKKKSSIYEFGGGRSTAVNDGLLKFKRIIQQILKSFLLVKELLIKEYMKLFQKNLRSIKIKIIS